MVVRSASNWRPTRGAPRIRAIRMTATVGGFGVARGPVDDPNPAFHFHSPQTRAISITRWDQHQYRVNAGGYAREKGPTSE